MNLHFEPRKWWATTVQQQKRVELIEYTIIITDTYFYRRLSYMSLNNSLWASRWSTASMGVCTLSSKPRWACSMCGMYSSRKYSVKRHIIKLHNGVANIVSFIDYLAGRRWGYYFPNPSPTYFANQSHPSKPNRPVDILKDELFRTALRRQLRYHWSRSGVRWLWFAPEYTSENHLIFQNTDRLNK